MQYIPSHSLQLVFDRSYNNLPPPDQLQQHSKNHFKLAELPNCYHEQPQTQPPLTPMHPSELVQWHKMPSGMQKPSEVLHHLEEKLSSTSQLDAQVSAVDVSISQLSTQPDAPQPLGTHSPVTLSQSGPLRSQTTPTPLTRNVSQLSETVHRHHFVDQGPLCGEPVNEPPAVVLLESVEELYSQRYMESLVQQEAFSRSPEGQEKLHTDHNLLKTEEYSHMPLEVMEIEPLDEYLCCECN